MFAESSDDEQIIERVAALDIGKAEIVCCVRLPGADSQRRVQEVSTHSTMVPSLCELANRLVGLGVERVVMEATSDYWRPPFYLFEAHGLEPWLVNAKDVKHLPGRPKTDRLDAVWLCKVAERQMLPQATQPRPPTRSTRLPRHPRPRRLTNPSTARCCLVRSIFRSASTASPRSAAVGSGLPRVREWTSTCAAVLSRSFHAIVA